MGIRQHLRLPPASSGVIPVLRRRSSSLSRSPFGANTAHFLPAECAHAEEPALLSSRADGHDLHAGHWLPALRSAARPKWRAVGAAARQCPSLISAVSSRGTSGVNLGLGSHGQYLRAGRISAHYLDVLALQPILGRNFSEDEDRPHGPKAAVLSYGLWRNTFNSNPDILGQFIVLKGEPHTVIGVLPIAQRHLERRPIYRLQPSRGGEGSERTLMLTRLRDGARGQEADAEINRACPPCPRYALQNSPGAAGDLLFRPAPERRDRLASSASSCAHAGRRLHTSYRLRQPGWLTLVRMLRRRSRSSHPSGVGSFALANPESSSGSKTCCWHSWASG